MNRDAGKSSTDLDAVPAKARYICLWAAVFPLKRREPYTQVSGLRCHRGVGPEELVIGSGCIQVGGAEVVHTGFAAKLTCLAGPISSQYTFVAGQLAHLKPRHMLRGVAGDPMHPHCSILRPHHKAQVSYAT
jgi:hypothetical protein